MAALEVAALAVVVTVAVDMVAALLVMAAAVAMAVGGATAPRPLAAATAPRPLAAATVPRPLAAPMAAEVGEGEVAVTVGNKVAGMVAKAAVGMVVAAMDMVGEVTEAAVAMAALPLVGRVAATPIKLQPWLECCTLPSTRRMEGASGYRAREGHFSVSWLNGGSGFEQGKVSTLVASRGG